MYICECVYATGSVCINVHVEGIGKPTSVGHAVNRYAFVSLLEGIARDPRRGYVISKWKRALLVLFANRDYGK